MDNLTPCCITLTRAQQLLEQCRHEKLVGFAALRVSSLKAERIGTKVYRTSAKAKADVFGYLSPIDFEREAGVA